MRAPPTHHNSLNLGATCAARLAVPLVDPMLKLEEATNPVGIDIVGNR